MNHIHSILYKKIILRRFLKKKFFLGTFEENVLEHVPSHVQYFVQ